MSSSPSESFSLSVQLVSLRLDSRFRPLLGSPGTSARVSVVLHSNYLTLCSMFLDISPCFARFVSFLVFWMLSVASRRPVHDRVAPTGRFLERPLLMAFGSFYPSRSRERTRTWQLVPCNRVDREACTRLPRRRCSDLLHERKRNHQNNDGEYVQMSFYIQLVATVDKK